MNRPPFVPFDEQRAVQIYRRSLPHWRQDGVTYFVTFRLGDSIPTHVTRQWNDERHRWLAARLRRTDLSPSHTRSTDLSPCHLSPRDQFLYHKHFNRKLQDYLDREIGECHLRDPRCVSIVRDQILSADGGSYHAGDFVVMPNHVHWLLAPATDEKLEQILRKIKGAVSHDCNLELQRSGTFWQPESYDHIVRSLEQLLAYREYIAANPQRAGIQVAPAALYRADWMDEWFNSP